MNTFWKSLAAGYAVLVSAIAINVVASMLDLKTWYGLFEDPSIGVLDALFLFFLYPLLLGLAATSAIGLVKRIRSRNRANS
jgi:hypothetical protein